MLVSGQLDPEQIRRSSLLLSLEHISSPMISFPHCLVSFFLKTGHSSSGFFKNLGPFNESSRASGVIPLVKASAGLWLDLMKWNSSGSIFS